MPRILQPSFGGGEYDPALWGRQDLGRYGISGRLVSNWIVRPTGGLESRPGTVFVGAVKDSARPVRFIRFQVSETLAYLAIVNAGVIQFIYRGAFVESGGSRVEVAHPYADDEIAALRYTQSADTAFIVHENVSPRRLQRTSSVLFTLSTIVFREGPFRSLNSNEALKLAASAKTGTVTVTANFDLFTANMVGALIYLEPEALGTIKPWVQGERTPNLAVGQLRRSDGKIYRAATVAFTAGAGNYAETGNVRPVHEIGREWDGPGDDRTFSGITYRVGVEWEYMHSGYGIVEITQFTDAREITGTVRKTLPDQVVGGVGAPANSWTFSGTNSVGPYAITGATSDSKSDYSVTIDGDPVQSDPNYMPPGGNVGSGGGGNTDYLP